MSVASENTLSGAENIELFGIVDDRRACLLFDTQNPVLFGLDPVLLASQVAHLVGAYVHVKDGVSGEGDANIGSGAANVFATLRMLVDRGFNGELVLENNYKEAATQRLDADVAVLNNGFWSGRFVTNRAMQRHWTGKIDTSLVIPLVFGVFVADLIVGLVSPIFSLFATRNGTSILVLAVVLTFGAFAGLCTTFPHSAVGRSDREAAHLLGGGRDARLELCSVRRISGQLGLALPRAMLGVATVSTFPIGVACLSDGVTPELRPRAVGLYASAMGAGFAVGPLLGGWSATELGYRLTFTGLGWSAGSPVTGIWVSRRLNKPALPRETATTREPALSTEAKDPKLLPVPEVEATDAGAVPRARPLLVSISNLPASLSVGVAILTFFPLYTAGLGWSPLLIGLVLFIRALASAGYKSAGACRPRDACGADPGHCGRPRN